MKLQKSLFYSCVLIIVFFIYNLIVYYKNFSFENFLILGSLEALVSIFFISFLGYILRAISDYKFLPLMGGWYIFIFYHLKQIGIISSLDNISNLDGIDKNVILNSLVNIYPSIVVQTIILFALLFFSFALFSKSKESIYIKNEINYKKFTIIILLSLLLKIIVHHVLGMGIPGAEPATVIPGIGGIITFYVRFALFALLNLFLLYALENKQQIYKLLSFSFILAFVLIDLSIGVKFSMFYQAFFLIMLYFKLKEKLKISLPVLSGIIIFMLVLFVIYDYVNYYRFAMLKGYDLSSAVEIAMESDAVKSSSFFWSIFNRIAGIENVIFLDVYRSGLHQTDMTDLFTGDFLIRFTETVTGISGAINAIGSTQIGINYLLFTIDTSYFFVSVLFYVLLVGMLHFTSVILYRFYTTREERYVLAILMGIFFIYFLFGAGNAIYFFKEFTIFFLSVLLIKIFLVKRYV